MLYMVKWFTRTKKMAPNVDIIYFFNSHIHISEMLSSTFYCDNFHALNTRIIYSCIPVGVVLKAINEVF